MDNFSLKCKQFLLETERYKKSDRIRVFAYPDSSDPTITKMEVRKMFHKGLGSPIISIPTKEIEYWEQYKMRTEKISKLKQLINEISCRWFKGF
jgi:hypothetical protein